MKEEVNKLLESIELLGQDKNLKVPDNGTVQITMKHVNWDAEGALKAFGLKVVEEINKTFYNETIQFLYNRLVRRLTENIEPVTVNEIGLNEIVNVILYGSKKNMLNNKLRKINNKKSVTQKLAKTIITNGNIASILQDSKDYIFDGTVYDNSIGSIYETGSYNDSAIYVNPYFRWDENTIILLYSDKFWNFSFDLSKLESEKCVEINQHFENINYKTYKLIT